MPETGLVLARILASVVVPLMAASCSTFSPPPQVMHEPRSVPAAPFETSLKPVALVLSGGAARGFAHVGVLRVLEENGIRPDIIVGSSAGSIVGALYASGLSADELAGALSDMRLSDFGDVVVPGLGFLPGEPGFVKGERLRVFVRDRLRHERIEDFPIRFAAVATDMRFGQAVAFNAGDASLAVRASSAVPGVLTPAEIGGRYFGDGDIASPLPVATARELGAKVVIAVDVLYPPGDALVSSVFSVVFQAFTISINRLRDHEARQADVLITPQIPSTDAQYGFAQREMLIRAGESAARAALPQITRTLAAR